MTQKIGWKSCCGLAKAAQNDASFISLEKNAGGRRMGDGWGRIAPQGIKKDELNRE